MNQRFAVVVLGLLLCTGSAWAQQGVIEATTSAGEKVRLLPDGRWEFVDGQKAAVQRSERAVEEKKKEEVRAAEIKRERAAQGGGRPDMAQAGGTEPAKLPEALKSVAAWVAQRV